MVEKDPISMAKTCIQCGKKMGMFQKAVDGIYCSLECSSAAQKEIAETERRAAVQRAEQEKVAASRAAADAAKRAEEQALAKALTGCPKCGAAWKFQPRAGEPGYAGQCPKCGLAATFLGVEKCPSCDGMTLLVESATTSRCPRCKYRQG
jgi:hypothetical protein